MATQNSFLSDLLKMGIGTAIPQGVNFLLTPAITRIYSPEALGVTTIFLSLAAIVNISSCLRYELAIMLPKEDQVAEDLILVSLLFCFITSIMLAVTLLFLGHLIAATLKCPSLQQYFWCLPPFVMINGLILVFTQWCLRNQLFSSISISRASGSLMSVGIKLGLGVMEFATAGSLLAGETCRAVASSAYVMKEFFQNHKISFFWSRPFWRLAAAAKQHKRFPIFNTWTGLLSSLTFYLPTMVLAHLFDATVVGYYALANLVVQQPLTLLSTNISQVFYQRISKAKDISQISSFLHTTTHHIMRIGIIPVVILGLIGQDLFTLLFGSQWQQSGIYFQVMCPYLFFSFLNTCVSTSLYVIDRQDAVFYANAMLALFRLLSVLIGGFFRDALLTIGLISICDSIIYAIYTYWILKNMGFTNSQLSSLATVNFTKSAIFVGPVILLFLVIDLTPALRVIIAATAIAIHMIIIANANKSLLLSWTR